LCAHTCTEDSGCVTKTLSCLHEHSDACGYIPGNPGAPCTFVCRVCPIEDLIAKLPDSVSVYNREQVQVQLTEIFDLYEALSEDEQLQVDLLPCVSLWEQLDGSGVAVLGDSNHTMVADENRTTPWEVVAAVVFNTDGHTLTLLSSASDPNDPPKPISAMKVTPTGTLEITGGGKIVSQKGAGVEVQAGGSLCVTGSDITITGTAHALDIATGSKVQLSTGTFVSVDAKFAAIYTADGDYAALLADGCAYFDTNSMPVSPADVATLKRVTVKQCTDHSGRTYTHIPGTLTHSWTCSYCGTTGSEACTFTFDAEGNGTCDHCKIGLTIAIDPGDLAKLVYSGTIKPKDVGITFTLSNGTALTLEGEKDYTAKYSIHKDAGEVAVEVTGITFGGTFTKTYTVERLPVLTWNTTPIMVDYDGDPVEASALPQVTINIENPDGLRGYLKYSHKIAGADDSTYTEGLPTNAGTYDVIVSLPAMDNFEGAVSVPIMLTIKKINPLDPLAEAPAATKPVFNRSPQALVTAGTLCEVAVRDGIKILFATSAAGPYSETIPTGTNAGNYAVWYKVEGTENYNAVGPALVPDVKILRKQITPKVTLSDYTYLYDGGFKQPKVTVTDKDDQTVLLDTEYAVSYVNNQNVSTEGNPAKVVVIDKTGGNYEIKKVEVPFEITLRTQDTLSITQKPNTVTYGGKFTLGTSGGSGNGLVTWEITEGKDVATVDKDSGQVTIIGDGPAKVQATKSGEDPGSNAVNYNDATASWTLTAAKKPVVATVTAEDKDYDGNADATVHAVVEEGVLAGDEIIIDMTGRGQFRDANAGIDKPVDVNTTGAVITGNNSQHYDVSYSSTTVKATIHKAVVEITAPQVATNLTYNGTEQTLIATGAVVNTAGVDVEYALSEEGPYSTDFPKGTNAGTYTVWYRIQETDNYTGEAPANVTATIAKKSVSPNIALDQDSFVYDGTPKEPVVTLTEAGGTATIPANEYTVTYSNNINVGNDATVTVTAKEDGNYSFTPVSVTEKFSITKEPARVITAPKRAGDPLIFSNRDQELVIAGTASGGTMVYSVDDANGTYQEAIPTRMNAAQYTVYYKVQGDANHSDSDVGSVTVTIDPKVVNPATIELLEGGAALVNYTYDGTAKEPKVVVKDGSTVIKDKEYNVIYRDNTDAGRATVEITDAQNGNYVVTGSTTFVIQKADIKFSKEPTAAVLIYTGTAQELLEPCEFSGGTIQYALNSSTSGYSDAIPTGTEAGDYTVYYKVEGDKNHNDVLITSVSVTIKKAKAEITAAPAKIDPLTYNRQPQALVTPGKSSVGFLVYSLDGTNFSPEIPTGTDAGTYTVYYKVDGTTNYDGVDVNETPISVTIAPKTITPKVELSESSYTYDGKKKNPIITVKDGSTVIEAEQYTVLWANSDTLITDGVLTAAGTYTATITSVANGNYKFTGTATVEIIAAAQNALKITNKREHVYYGDTFTLDTSGGSENGTVEWSVAPGDSSTTIDPNTGELTVNATGTFTVKAVRKVPNYGDVNDSWTFTVEPKQVVAAVTVTPKVYDGNAEVADDDIEASVKPSDLVSGDSLLLTGLKGTYDNANVGTGKTVTLDDSGATKADGDGKYVVSYPATATGDITPKNVTVTVTLSDHDLKAEITDDTTTYYYEYDGTEKKPSVTVTADDGATLATSDYTVDYSNNKNVGTATVAVKNAAGGNYTFNGVTVNFTIEQAGAVLTSSPKANDLTYEKGTNQELVSVGAATGGTVVYALKMGTTEPGVDDYSADIPTGENAGTYTVYYKVKGDANHADTEPGQVTVIIKPREFTPVIELNPTSYVYDGNECKPAVTVRDGNVEIDNTDNKEYTVSYRDNINAGTATVIVSDANGGNYIVNGTASFTITKKEPAVTAPKPKTDLQYNGERQELVTAGVCNEGTVYYSVNGGNYSTAIPTASEVGPYTIDYKVEGDANHSDTTPVRLDTVEIARNTVTNPTISLSSDTFKYNSSQQKPTITVYDDHSRIIPEREYTVTITGTNGNVGMVDADTYTITIAAAANSNYVFQGDCTTTFEIVAADQEIISITGTKVQVFYGDVLPLGTSGGISGGTVKWEITGHTDTDLTQAGLLTVKDVDTTIKVTVTSSRDNYAPVSATWEFTAAKKPVTAVVTVASKAFDNNNTVASDAITATVKPGDLAFSDDEIKITGLTGTFDDANVGTDKKVTVNSSSPTVIGKNAEKYDITYPATTTASIWAVSATVATEPEAVSPLTYDAGQAQVLVTEGTATGGMMVYSLDGTNYVQTIPKAKDAGTYTVYYKAQGDRNHTDSETETVEVTINQQTVAPQIELSPPSAPYDGTVKHPEVTVRDTANNVIPTSEYKAVYNSGTNWKDVGKHKVTVQNVVGGNYVIIEDSAEFEISATAQAPLEIVNKPGLVYYGDTFSLSTSGGSSSEKVTWSSSDENIAHVDDNGFVTIEGTGSATITATKAGGTNYDTATATYPLNALKKSITAIVTADDRVYASGVTTATIHVTWKPGDLVGTDKIDTTGIAGAFADDSVGTGKTVSITGVPVSDATSQKYDITIPPTTTASILKAVATAPTLTANNRVYDGTAQDLVSSGGTGTFYSSTKDGVYSATVPQKTNAGTYTVWYKAQGDDNHTESEPQSCTVTISPKTLTEDIANITLSGNDLQTETKDGATVYYYLFDGTDKTPTVTIKDGSAVVPAREYTVSYSGNKNVTTADTKATVTITDNEGGNYTVSGSVTFEIHKGSAQLTSSPQARTLTYTGQPQELVTVGTATGGHIEYSQDGTNYGSDIPTGTDAGTYTVQYKVVGDSNHEASATVGSVSVTISPKTVISPVITVTGGPYTYNGSAKEPGNVKVEDGTTTIPDTEYVLSYRDNVNAGTATVIVTNANSGNYIVNGTGTFEIAKVAPNVVDPKGKTGLKYNGELQELVEAGSTSDGTLVYSLTKDGEYTPAIPTGKDVREYEIWYKVLGDQNHSDTAPAKLADGVRIDKNTVTNPTIQVTPPKVTYTGEKQEPTVTVKDDQGLVIDGSEYTVAYADEAGNSTTELKNVGSYTLTITGTGANYSFNATAKFEILPADQTPLTITGTRERVYYGDTIQLRTTGGNGTLEWKVSDGARATITDTGLLTITGSGAPVTVTATSKATGYEDQTAAWFFYAEKKPVTAVVTAAAKTYDGVTPATTAVTATVQSSDLVDGDKIQATLTGTFEDPNAGTDKKVNVDSTNPDFTGSTGQDNYNITYPATTTASILKAEIATVTAPVPVEDLKYTGLPLTLVKAGSAVGGTMEYSVDKITYSATLPTGTNVGEYEISYRVKGDGNHKDREAATLTDKATIVQQEVTAPTIELTPTGAIYDGKEHKPTVTVKDKHGRVIPDSEYAVSYGDGNWTKAGTYTVTVTDKDTTSGNYNITTKTVPFSITHMDQSPLSIMNQPGLVQYGDRAFTLTAVGGSGTGTVTWDSNNKDVATIDQNGLVTVRKAGGPVTIKATKATDGGYSEVSATWTFSVEKKPVTPIVTAKDKVYDEKDTAQLVIRWQSGDLVAGDTITLDLTGKFNSADVGTDKVVTITGTAPESDKYDIKIPVTTTASITPKAASVEGTTPDTLTYTGSELALVSGLTVKNGTLAYSRNGSYYTLSVPKETNAGTYTVWYKAQASGNYTDSPAVGVEVTIKPKEVTNPTIELSPESFDYDGTAKKPDVVVKEGNTVIPASEYTVGYSNNTAIGTATVTISNAPGGNYTVSGSKTFEIKAGAPAIVSAPEPRELTYNGKAQTLVTPGTAVNGRVMYLSEETGDYITSIPRGTDAGSYEVWYKVVSTDGSEETTANLVEVEISPKSVTPTILLNGQYSYSTPYTGSAITPAVTVKVGSQTLVFGNDYSVSCSKNTNVGTAEVIVESTDGNYEFFSVVTFEITKGKATFYAAPEPVDGLVYTGEPQVLVTNGIAEHPDDGVVLYSLNGGTYGYSIPTGTQKGRYTVSAKVEGNSMYEDSDVVRCTVDIGINEVKKPTVELSQSSFTYTGSVQKPTITVSDDGGDVISSSEYQVTYTGDTINPGTYTLTITSREKNYSFDSIKREITILPAGQTPLTITGKKDTVYYGDVLSLGATGGAGDGTVTWTASGLVDDLGNGQYKVTSGGSVTITATKGEATDTWTFYAQPKPVTAVVTAANKTYDNSTNATLTVTFSGLVGSDTFTVTAQGHFTDADVGTNKTVIITGLTIPDDVSKKYAISYNSTTTASITPQAATVTVTPVKAGSLTYNGSAQPLLTNGGAAEGGYMMYSLDGRDYTYNIPTGTDAGSYTVWYKVAANDDNHKDSTPVNLGTVTISANTDAPTVTCTSGTVKYDGTVKTPTVVVTDRAGRIIPESEYTVAFEPSSLIAVGKYKVIVTDKPGGNYKFDTPVTKDDAFEIVAADQNPLSIVTSETTVYYGDTVRLTAMGGSGSGAIQWSIKNTSGASVAEVTTTSGNNCVVTVKGIGGFTVEAYREAADGYSKSNTDSVPFEAKPKPVTPVVTAEDKPYDGKTDATLRASWPSGALVGADEIPLTVEGQFATADVGTNKQVKLTKSEAAGADTSKYAIIWPDNVTASISKVDAKLQNLPVANNLTYQDGTAQALVTAGTTVNGIGTIVYCRDDQNGTYSESIPTATNIGEYTVWYKVADSVNYTGIPAASVKAEIKENTSTPPIESPSAFPDSMFMSPVNTPGAVGAPSADPTGAPIQATVQDGTASTVVSSADGEQLVKEAVESQSRNIVIKPEISGDVTKAQVSIPASTVNQIKSETDASLTVSAPMADVTIPQAALDTLGSTGGTIDVVTEQVDRALVLTLTADGEKVENVPGGVTLTVPAEDAGPGTVAVLVHADGTRETIRKSVAGDGKVSIPLSGSAAVEIVDNSKTFADVPPTSWAADAAAFVSARELFGGTGETTFSPDEPMSRGMLATVLYRLEGSPSQDAASGFSDVSGDAWYADGIAWAAENGIADGYGNGQFGPDESVTREQFAVMLWKYAGSPETDDQSLAFTDADQASDYARKALLWAVRNGIMSGDGHGQLAPGETATRAEAAQMLKNFMENT